MHAAAERAAGWPLTRPGMAKGWAQHCDATPFSQRFRRRRSPASGRSWSMRCMNGPLRFPGTPAVLPRRSATPP